MSNVKKAIVLILAILVIFVCCSTDIFASTIQPKTNNTSNNVASNNVANEAANNATNNVSNNATTNNAANNISNVTNNSTTLPVTNNSTHQINTTNATEDIPHTGIGDTYFSFALIILLALVLGMFSLVQYNKIIKKEKDD